MTALTDKNSIRDAIHILKKKGVIKFDSDIAKDLDYSRGAVSEMLSLTSGKDVSYSFIQKFKEKYGQHLGDAPEPDKMKVLEAKIKVFEQMLVSTIEKVTGKNPALIAAEIEEAVKVVMKS